MEGGFFKRLVHLETPSQRVVRELEGFLEAAMAMPDGTFPRIPLRAVHDGGWRERMATDEGRAWADAWWNGAFAGMEADR